MRTNEYSDYRSVIADSWNRCIAWGLDHDHVPAPLKPEPARLEEINQQHSELLTVTEAEVLPYYRNVLANGRCLIVLADPMATVLNCWGDERITETHLKPWFQAGANWQEQNCGTNAIGTSIALGAPVQIQRNEHFLKTNRSIISSAAPIFDAHRQIAGVLSVFSDAYLPQAHTLGMVRLLSQSVENRLINRQFGPDHFQITLNTTADNFDSPWSGILMCDDSGQVVASNQRADQLLGMNTVEARLDELFRARWNQILGHPETENLQLTTRSKVRLSARIKHPTRIVDTAEKTGPSTASEDLRQPFQPLDIDDLDFGDSAVKRCATQGLKVLERGLPVLITGETGVGKEVLVKALHRACHRKDQPLVAVNCAAIPPELVESELFGYEAGAFTGARAQGSLGLIRKAHKGVLFLDEIGEMPLSAQSRLLRVLQERVVTPVGSTESLPVDVLLVTATNRPLTTQIGNGHFRADLYYRINGLCVELPALRNRADRRMLIQSLYARHRDPGQSEQLSSQVLSALENHPWPGNIRQLENVLRVAIAIADGKDMQVWHLPEDFLAEFETSSVKESDPTIPEQSGSGFKMEPEDTLARTLQIYRQCAGNVSQAARELDISRNTLYKRLRELGIR